MIAIGLPLERAYAVLRSVATGIEPPKQEASRNEPVVIRTPRADSETVLSLQFQPSPYLASISVLRVFPLKANEEGLMGLTSLGTPSIDLTFFCFALAPCLSAHAHDFA
jgi:hypothetical protein